MCSSNPLDLLSDIQALSIAAHEQTGIPTCYSCFTTELYGEPLILHARVTIMPDVGTPWSMKGTTSRYPGDTPSLQGLRYQLTDWIAANRKGRITTSPGAAIGSDSDIVIGRKEVTA